MTNKEILQSDLLEILFENRNKEYGAYTLRRNYNHNMGIALGCALSIVVVLILFNSFSEKNGGNIIKSKPSDPVKLTDYNQHPEKPIKPEIRPVKQVKNVGIKIVPYEVPQPEVPDQSQFNEAVISDKNEQGVTPIGMENGIDAPEISDPATEQSKHENTIIDKREIAASYPGGPQAFSDFLSRNLIAPEELESGEKKTVMVRFLVDVDGYISKIEIIQSAGKNFDKEVIRVLHKMPKWNPAEQNGHKVAIAFSQPVTFVGIEQ